MLFTLWGSIMSQSSTFTTCAVAESHSERQSGSEGSGIVIPAIVMMVVGSSYSDSCKSEYYSIRLQIEQICVPPAKANYVCMAISITNQTVTNFSFSSFLQSTLL